MKKLLIGTHNQGKLAELTPLISATGIELVTLTEYPGISDVEETGSSFAENAALKATEYARLTDLITLGDDSGLEIAALGGRPGVYSARYGGPNATFAERMEMVLAELDQTGGEMRGARFVCSVAVANPAGEVLIAVEGVCTGSIAREARGKGGFGYDPLFMPDGFDLTFGELSNEIKQKISHRRQAFEQIIPFLRDFIAV